MAKNWDSKTLINLLTLTSFICISFALIIILNVGTTSGYEISIYNVYPFYFWALLEIPLLIPFFVFILNESEQKYPKMALAGALISILIILSIPLFRGYPFYGAGDTYSHLSLIKEIMVSGHTGSDNPYPLIHIFVAILSNILNVKIEVISLVLMQLFYVFYISAVLVLTKSLKLNAKESYLVIFLSIIPVLESWLTVEYIMPSTEAFFFTPLILAVFVKSRTSSRGVEYSILTLILLTAISFFHPETALFIFVAFIALFMVFNLFNSKFYKNSNDVLHKLSSSNFLTPALFLIIMTILWFSSTLIFGNTLKSVYLSFTSNLYSTPITSLQSGLKTEFVDATSLAIKVYGVPIIYIVLSFLGLLGFFRSIIYQKSLNSRDVFLYSLFIVFLLTAFVFLRQGTAVGMLIYRPLKYVLLISTLISGIYLAKKFSGTYGSKLKKIFFTIIVFTVFFIVPTISVFGVYASPNTRGFNYEPTQTDFNSMEFFFSHRDPSNPVLETMLRGYTSRLSDYLVGYKKINWPSAYSSKNLPPSHFGYNSNQKLGSFYNNSHYLIVYPPSEYYYETVYSKYPDLERYDSNDFEKLNKDDTVSRVYDNGATNIMIIK